MRKLVIILRGLPGSGKSVRGKPVNYHTLKGYFKDFNFEPRDTHGRE